MEARGGLWFGWSGELTADAAGTATIAQRHDVSYATISLPQSDYELYHDGFCNRALWPLLHYFIGATQFAEQDFAAYVRVNRLFADRLLPLLDADDIIWVHDHHLIPLGRELRAREVSLPIGFFLYTPFPHIETLRALPRHKSLVRDLLSYDLVGFQTRRDLESFRSAVTELFGPCSVQGNVVHVEGLKTRLGVFPAGIDVDAVQRKAQKSQSSDTVRRMSKGLFGRRCVVGVDRLDYCKGLAQRFEAYQQFLASHPEQLSRVTFLQIAPPSRTDPGASAGMRSSLEQLAGRINGRFAETDWTPIRYLNRHFSHEVLMGFLRNACVGMVTPLRDGMNLVAKEYVAAQDPEDPGVLVLSTLAGAAEEMAEALLVNPRDAASVSDALHRALDMSLDERRARHQQLLGRLRANDVHAWHERFLSELVASAVDEQPVTPASPTSALPPARAKPGVAAAAPLRAA
jgi:trehalose 6-phosphate synthase